MIDWSEYDFIDLGCSKGSSLRHCIDRFAKPRGVGVDINPRKAETTRAAGYQAITADATTLVGTGQVSFVSMMNFLEHLPSLEMVERVIAASARTARDYLFIRNPSFEGEEMSEAIGYRQYWWHWTGHSCHPRVADFVEIFNRLGLNTYMIRNVERVVDTSHESVVPVSAPVNTSLKMAKEIPREPVVQLPRGWFRRQDIFVQLRPFDPAEWAAIVAPTATVKKLGVY